MPARTRKNSYNSRALCNLQILKHKQSVLDFKQVLILEPQNSIARSQLEATQKLIRRIEFEKAIEVEEEVDAAERCRELINESAFFFSFFVMIFCEEKGNADDDGVDFLGRVNR